MQEGTFVNGQRIETVDLHDGDRINIGGYEMMFHLRGTSAPARQQASLAGDADESRAHRHAAGRCERQSRRPLPRSMRRGRPTRSAPATVTRIGRALDNEIVVSHSSISRHHASIENSNGVIGGARPQQPERNVRRQSTRDRADARERRRRRTLRRRAVYLPWLKRISRTPRFCSRCGQPIVVAEASFCKSCGAPVTQFPLMRRIRVSTRCWRWC